MRRVHFDDNNTVFKDYIFENEQNDRELEFNNINIFVGANNSGKSRFLRELFKQHRRRELDQLNRHLDNIDFPYIKIQKALEVFEPVFKSYLNTKTKDSVTENDKEYINKQKKKI